MKTKHSAQVSVQFWARTFRLFFEGFQKAPEGPQKAPEGTACTHFLARRGAPFWRRAHYANARSHPLDIATCSGTRAHTNMSFREIYFQDVYPSCRLPGCIGVQDGYTS